MGVFTVPELHGLNIAQLFGLPWAVAYAVHAAVAVAIVNVHGLAV